VKSAGDNAFGHHGANGGSHGMLLGAEKTAENRRTLVKSDPKSAAGAKTPPVFSRAFGMTEVVPCYGTCLFRYFKAPTQ